MKKVLLITLTAMLCSLQTLYAQSWNLVGNSNATSASKLGTTNNVSLRFYTNNVQRMIINSAAGYVGIGTITPTERLHVNSASGANAFRAQVNGSTKLLVHSNGGVVVGTSSTPPSNGLYVSGNTGIGTFAPENKLHVFKGSAGSVAGWKDAPLIVENSVNSYINILAPDAAATGVIFGKPASNISGGIFYNDISHNPNGFDFRTNGNITQMVLNNAGNLGVGTVSPGDYKLKISHDSYVEGSGPRNRGYGLDIENASNLDDWELYTNGNSTTATGDLHLWFNGSFRAGIRSSSGDHYSISDERLKTKIKPMSTMLGKIMQLKPSTYQFNNTRDQQQYNGFIAQDVMKIFPSLVMHNVNAERKLDVYTMNYSGFGVIAIKGIQELQPIIEEQKVKIATLEERINKLEAALANLTANNNGKLSTVITNASLEQNNPNPVAGNTIIRYQIPTTSISAKITITNIKGQLIKAIIIGNMGAGQVNFNSATLPAGSYNYSLWVDRKQVDTKRLIIAR